MKPHVHGHCLPPDSFEYSVDRRGSRFLSTICDWMSRLRRSQASCSVILLTNLANKENVSVLSVLCTIKAGQINEHSPRIDIDQWHVWIPQFMRLVPRIFSLICIRYRMQELPISFSYQQKKNIIHHFICHQRRLYLYSDSYLRDNYFHIFPYVMAIYLQLWSDQAEKNFNDLEIIEII